MRAVVDSIPSTELEPLFADLFKPLQRGKLLEQFTIFNGGYFVPIDGFFFNRSHSCFFYDA
ncbi:MAG: hypothetical protein KAI40_03595 [Desulfobacterales bacterium]|nr:hypothetical protein [Desulfobacterales bacterium]